jgi:hypothetical protein
MALLEDLTEGVTTGMTGPILLGLGVVLVAPSLLPGVASALRPLAKALVKGGVVVYDAAKETVAEATEEFNDLVAEARAEMAEPAKAEPAAAIVEEKKASRRTA